MSAEYRFLQIKWKVTGAKMPSAEEIDAMRKNVTFIYKSFERKKYARQLYHNIQKYYPGVRVIIADDSAIPLELDEEYAEVLHLPFNSGLSYGLNRALSRVETPYVIRMDDDELLTPFTRFEEHYQFLQEHPEVDLVGVFPYTAPLFRSIDVVEEEYYRHPMSHAEKELRIPHMTRIDEEHVVVGKSPNIFLVSTEKLRSVGYDDNIRMIDHQEFFYRAAGNLVSVIATSSYVFHRHNIFDRNYHQYRCDVENDRIYIALKMSGKLRMQQKPDDRA